MAKVLKDLRLYTIFYDLYDCTPNSRVGLNLLTIFIPQLHLRKCRVLRLTGMFMYLWWSKRLANC